MCNICIACDMKTKLSNFTKISIDRMTKYEILHAPMW